MGFKIPEVNGINAKSLFNVSKKSTKTNPVTKYINRNDIQNTKKIKKRTLMNLGTAVL